MSETRSKNPFLRTLVGDCIAAVKVYEAEASEANARNLVRAIFASIDGLIWLYRGWVAAFVEAIDEELTPLEALALDQKSYSVSARGGIKEVPRYIEAVAYIKLITRLASRHCPNLTLSFEGEGWTDFQDALKVRHRLVHPKSMDDLRLSEGEIHKVQMALGWFLEFIETAMSETNDRLANHTSELKRFLEEVKLQLPHEE